LDAETFEPANHADIIAVSAITDTDGKCGALGPTSSFGDPDDALASFSNSGSVVDMAAPGVDILSTPPGGQVILVVRVWRLLTSLEQQTYTSH
jgi:subtilisin